MKLADMNPSTGRAFDAQSYRKVGNWAWRDGWDYEGMPVRYVWHYSTLMFEFVGDNEVPWRVGEWRVRPHSLGYGSVSDQQGCNRIIGAAGDLYYSRKGGSRWVQR